MPEFLPPQYIQDAFDKEPEIAIAANFLFQLQAFQLGDREDVEYPINGTKHHISTIPTIEEAKNLEIDIRRTLSDRCGGDERLALDARDYYLFKFLYEHDAWPQTDDK